MKLTNNQIYAYSQALHTHYGPSCELKMPVRINFFLQKNITVLMTMAQEIEKARLAIAQEYGTINESGDGYTIDPEKFNEVNAQLQELFNLEQDVSLHIFKLEDFDGLEFTFAQMNALMFMIEE